MLKINGLPRGLLVILTMTFAVLSLSVAGPLSAFAEVPVVTIACSLQSICSVSPLLMCLAVPGRCQGPIGTLAPGEARAVDFLLPPEARCFPIAVKALRLSEGNSLDATAPPGAWIAPASLVTGRIGVYVKNDSDQTIADTFAGLLWECSQ